MHVVGGGVAMKQDQRVSVGSVTGVLFISIGVIVLATAPFLIDTDPSLLISAAAISIVSGIVVWVLPWESWPPIAPVAVAVWSIAILGWVSWQSPEATSHFLPIYVVLFIAAAVAIPRSWIGVLLVLATVTFVVPAVRDGQSTLVVDFAVAILVSGAAAWVMTGVLHRYQNAGGTAERVLAAAQAITKTTMAAETIVTLREGMESVTPADVVEVRLSDGPERSTAVSIEATFVPDVRHASSPATTLPAAVRTAVIVPLLNERFQFGTLTLGWMTPNRRPDAVSVQAATVLAGEAARVLHAQHATSVSNHAVLTDPLTGMNNRRAMDERLARLEPGDSVAVIDLDHFKHINDTHGHPVGDQVLKTLAASVAAVNRGIDWCGRLGGEEFVIIYPKTGLAGADAAVERLRAQWQTDTQGAVTTTFSAGVAVHQYDSNADDTLRSADDAMYEAKRGGRNRTVQAPASAPLGGTG